MNIQETEQRYAFEVYPKRDLTLVRGEGAVVWDDAGRSYIDCAAGTGVACLGHAHPVVVEALNRQARTLITCGGVFYNDRRAELLARLVSVAPDSLMRAFLCNSGSEAIETAFKFARLATGRTDIVAAARGFHGRTMGALSATHKKEYRQPFAPLVPGVTHVPYNNLDKLAEAVTDRTAAVVLEPIQGEGGVHRGADDYLNGVRELCDERGTLLIADEIQTGFCRTGRMFAVEHSGVQPDIMCVAKGIAGGVPMGAALFGDTVKPVVGIHGSTFGGNPLACAVADATIDHLVEHDLAGRAAESGAYFAELFERSRPACVRQLRQFGLMIGIELKERSQPHLVALMEEGVLALPAGKTVIRLLPPLVIERAQIEAVVAALCKVLSR
jgi:acetylornithine/LysW-gamma-L-lysine aminotransferase